MKNSTFGLLLILFFLILYQNYNMILLSVLGSLIGIASIYALISVLNIKRSDAKKKKELQEQNRLFFQRLRDNERYNELSDLKDWDLNQYDDTFSSN